MEIFEANGHKWESSSQNEDYQKWLSGWYCPDGDGAELNIHLNKSGFELCCFSGRPASYIFVDVVDFSTLWIKAFGLNNIREYEFTQQCILLAEWFCSFFCEFKG